MFRQHHHFLRASSAFWPQSKPAITSMEYIQVSDSNALPDIRPLAPFKAVIAVEDAISSSRQQEICQWLVSGGCIYVMICGENSEIWQAMLREINLSQINLDDMKPEEFVMITTHEGERLRSVFWHAKKHAFHTHVKTDTIVTVHIGNQNRSTDYLAIFQKA